MRETTKEAWERIHRHRVSEEEASAERAREKIAYHKELIKHWEEELRVAEEELRHLEEHEVEL